MNRLLVVRQAPGIAFRTAIDQHLLRKSRSKSSTRALSRMLVAGVVAAFKLAPSLVKRPCWRRRYSVKTDHFSVQRNLRIPWRLLK